MNQFKAMPVIRAMQSTPYSMWANSIFDFSNVGSHLHFNK